MAQYRYDQRNFADSPGLQAEIEDFYNFLEKYRAEKTKDNWWLLDKQRRDLFFSIKHRVVEGRLTEMQAQEMRDYYGDLFDKEQGND
jgi:hypothetical protein